MNYLSKIELDLLSRKTRNVLSDLYRLHQSVMGGFKNEDPATQPRRILFRVEPEIRNDRYATLLVQSPVLPDWTHLQRYGAICETKAYEISLIEGSIYRFRLRANPVVCRNRKRYGLVGEADQRAWLLRKDCGVNWHLESVIDEGYKKGDKNGRMIQYKSVRYEGHLQVVDPAKLFETLREGIGPAKGFGFGLLSLAKV